MRNCLDLASPVAQFVLRFVQESNAIEDVSIPDDDLIQAWELGRGHMGALARALRLADRSEPLTLSHVCEWQAAVVREQLRYGHWIAEEHIGCLRTRDRRMGRRYFAAPQAIKPALSALLEDVNMGLSCNDEPALELAARIHRQFELIHPFVDGNGRTGRLIALYQLRAARTRPVLFTAGDRESCYFRAFEPSGPDAMVAYFRDHQVGLDPWALPTLEQNGRAEAAD